MKAKYVTCYEPIWFQNFILGLDIVDSIARFLKIFCDNSAVVSFSRNTRSSSHSKNIEIKYLFVREKVTNSHICVEHISIEHTLANPITKGLAEKVFKEHLTHMGLLEFVVILS